MNNPYGPLDTALRKIRKDGYSSSFMKHLQSKQAIEKFYEKANLSAGCYDSRLWSLKRSKENRINFTFPVLTGIALGIASIACSVFLDIPQMHAMFVIVLGGAYLLDSEEYIDVLTMPLGRVSVCVGLLIVLIILFYILAGVFLNMLNSSLQKNEYQVEIEIEVLEEKLKSVYENPKEFLAEELQKRMERKRKYKKLKSVIIPLLIVLIFGKIFMVQYGFLTIRDIITAIIGAALFAGFFSLYQMYEYNFFQKWGGKAPSNEENKE